MLTDLKTEIEDLLQPVIDREGFEVVEIKLSRYKNSYRLQVFVDSESGVTLDECAQLSRVSGSALDIADLFESPYILELSSPGLDRPLHTEKDFKRRIGEEVRIEYMENGRKRRKRGALIGVESGVVLLNDKDSEIRIALDKIEQGKVII